MVAALCVLGLLTLVLLVGLVDSAQSSAPSEATVQQATRAVEKFRATGFLVKFDCRARHDAYVNPVLWAALEHEQKRTATIAIAASCVGVGERQFVHIKDNMTGREIAQFYGGAYRVF